MRVLCRHGHLAFYPEIAGDVSMFANYYGWDLVSERDYYTFASLKGAPTYALQHGKFLGAACKKTFAGYPWEVMKANDLVYSIAQDKVISKTEVDILIEPIRNEYYFVAETPLVQAGSTHKLSGQRVLSFDGYFLQDYLQLRLSEFRYD